MLNQSSTIIYDESQDKSQATQEAIDAFQQWLDSIKDQVLNESNVKEWREQVRGFARWIAVDHSSMNVTQDVLYALIDHRRDIQRLVHGAVEWLDEVKQRYGLWECRVAEVEPDPEPVQQPVEPKPEPKLKPLKLQSEPDFSDNVEIDWCYPVSDEPSSRKTTATINAIAVNRHEKNHLYVPPTIQLCNQTTDNLIEKGVNPDVINHTTVSDGKSVALKWVEYLKDASDSGQVAVMTWQSYVNLPYFHRRGNWKIYIDEPPKLDTLFDVLKVDLEPMVELGDVVMGNLAELTIPDSVSEYRYNQYIKSISCRHTKNAMHAIRNDNFDIYVDARKWKEGGDIKLLVLLNEQLFRGVTILGADFEKSMLFKYLDQLDMQWIRDNEIIDNLHKPEVKQQRTLTVKPMGERLMSKYLLETKPDAIRKAEQAIIDDLSGEPFLMAVNKDNGSSKLLQEDNAVQASVISHGMNTFQHLHKAVWWAGLHRTPEHREMLRQLGFTVEDQIIDAHHTAMNQFHTRTSWRVHESDADLKWYVSSMQEAEWIKEGESADRFNVVIDESLMIPELMRDSPLTRSEETARRRVRLFFDQLPPNHPPGSDVFLLNKKEETRQIRASDHHTHNSVLKLRENQVELDVIHSDTMIEKADVGFNSDEPVGWYILDKKGKYNPKNYMVRPGSDLLEGLQQQPFITANIHDTRYNDQSWQFQQTVFSPEQFKVMLSRFSNQVVLSKEDPQMITPSIIIPRSAQGYRKLDNFFLSTLIVLDNDGGDCSIDDAIAAFDQISLPYIICNSFSASPEKPNKWRAFIPLKVPALTVWQYLECVYYIISVLPEAAELDPVIANPCQAYWVPGKNREHPEYQRFEHKGFTRKEIERHGIDPSWFRVEEIKPERVETVTTTTFTDGSSLVDSIKGEYRMTPKGQGKRNAAFYSTGIQLSNVRCSINEIRGHLTDLAGNDKKMLNRIDGIIRAVENRLDIPVDS